MKTFLVLALLSPLSASASYDCHGDAGSLVVTPVDATRVKASFGDVSFTGQVTSASGSVFRSTHYSLVAADGSVASLTVNVMPVLTRGGGFCGRGGCDPVQPLERISASLDMGLDKHYEFTCAEFLDEVAE